MTKFNLRIQLKSIVAGTLLFSFTAFASIMLVGFVAVPNPDASGPLHGTVVVDNAVDAQPEQPAPTPTPIPVVAAPSLTPVATPKSSPAPVPKPVVTYCAGKSPCYGPRTGGKCYGYIGSQAINLTAFAPSHSGGSGHVTSSCGMDVSAILSGGAAGDGASHRHQSGNQALLTGSYLAGYFDRSKP